MSLVDAAALVSPQSKTMFHAPLWSVLDRQMHWTVEHGTTLLKMLPPHVITELFVVPRMYGVDYCWRNDATVRDIKRLTANQDHGDIASLTAVLVLYRDIELGNSANALLSVSGLVNDYLYRILSANDYLREDAKEICRYWKFSGIAVRKEGASCKKSKRGAQ